MMPALVIPASSTEYVHVPVDAEHDPTGAQVEMAFTRHAIGVSSPPQAADWHAADWATSGGGTAWPWRARCLVGTAGGVSLAAGTYGVWLRVHDAPEVPVIYAGLLRIA